jgi:D-aminopeptidase
MAKSPRRARDHGIPFEGTPGPRNALVDVGRIAVGHRTVIAEPKVHTGVTVIWPRGTASALPVHAGYAAANGNGELTGAAWIAEGGVIEGPLALTNTYSVGTVRDALLRYLRAHWKQLGLAKLQPDYGALPVVAETWDGELNDIFGFHVTAEHVHEALAAATDASAPEPIAEGNVGGGTGMTLFDFKGGIGTASRIVGRHRVAVLAQCNFGTLYDLVVAGVPVGRYWDRAGLSKSKPKRKHKGSVIGVIATDAPLVPHQLARLARRATHGIARVGAISEDTSGDLFVAFSTGERADAEPVIATDVLDGLFSGVVHATEEAVINALVAARTVKHYEQIDIARLRRALRKHARLVE